VNQGLSLVLVFTGCTVLAASCAGAPPVPDFKRAVAIEYYDCELRFAPCPASGTEHVSIDPQKFRRSVASAVYVDFKVWRKGSSLLRVKLPDGRSTDYELPMGQASVDPPSADGSWIFKPGDERAFESLMGEAWQVVFPRRCARAGELSRRRATSPANP
jgi:hypothetical protein